MVTATSNLFTIEHAHDLPNRSEYGTPPTITMAPDQTATFDESGPDDAFWSAVLLHPPSPLHPPTAQAVGGAPSTNVEGHEAKARYRRRTRRGGYGEVID